MATIQNTILDKSLSSSAAFELVGTYGLEVDLTVVQYGDSGPTMIREKAVLPYVAEWNCVVFGAWAHLEENDWSVGDDFTMNVYVDAICQVTVQETNRKGSGGEITPYVGNLSSLKSKY